MIHALLGGGALGSEPAFAVLVKANQAMLDRFRARDWTGALEALAACRNRTIDLGLEEFYEMYETRIQAFQADPPPADWDGVFEAQFK